MTSGLRNDALESLKSNQCFSLDPQHPLKSYALTPCNSPSAAKRRTRTGHRGGFTRGACEISNFIRVCKAPHAHGGGKSRAWCPSRDGDGGYRAPRCSPRRYELARWQMRGFCQTRCRVTRGHRAGRSGVALDQSSPPWGGNGRFHKIPRQIEKYQSGGDKIEGRHGSSRLGGSRLGGRGCTETPTRPQYCSMPLEEIASVA